MYNVRDEAAEVTEFPSVEEGRLTQSENQLKEPNRDLLCSSLLGNASFFFFFKLVVLYYLTFINYC